MGNVDICVAKQSALRVKNGEKTVAQAGQKRQYFYTFLKNGLAFKYKQCHCQKNISNIEVTVTSIRYFFFFFLLLLHSPILTKPNIMPNTIPLWSNLTPLLQRVHVTGETIIVKCNLISLENDFLRKNIFQQDIQNFLPESNYLMFSFRYPHGIYNVILFYKIYKNIRKLTSYSHWI